MSDATEEVKHLLNETVRAFKTGLHGDEYVPGEAVEAVPEQPQKGLPDKYVQLEKLHELKLSGALTEEEYEREKAKLLGPT